MDLIVAQPLGWWALLGVPAVLAIHFLQSRTRREPVATLFLLDPLAEESRRGAVWTRLRASRQLWLQLLAVLLFTWLLLQPSWLREDSMQAVAIVLDSSRSMQPFRADAATQASAAMHRLDGAAGRTAWWILPSDESLPLLYRGDDRDQAQAALAAWRPARPHHDASSALRRARALVGGEGLVLWVTDRIATNLPPGVDLLAVGRPLENAGFTGFRIDTEPDGERIWIASILHQGVAASERRLTVQFDDDPPSAPEMLRLAPGRLVTVRGTVPPGARRGLIALDLDAFPADDRAPLVMPARKPLFYRLAGIDFLDDWISRVMASAEAAFPAMPDGPPAGLTWGSFDRIPPAVDHTGVLVYTGETVAPYAQPMAEIHPLVRDLPWSAFLGRAAPDLALQPGDTVLVWAGERPLVVLRERDPHRQLVLAFDPARSNADRLPAVLLTLHRFLEDVRSALPVYEAVNLEAGQPLALPSAPEGASPLEVHFTAAADRTGRRLSGPPFTAPDEAGWLRAARDGEALLDAAVLMIDAVEGNFTGAGTQPLPDGLTARQQLVHSRADLLAPLWFTLLALAAIASWPTGPWRKGAS